MTPGRSIAVDRLHEYGTPFFIEANLPIETTKQISPDEVPDGDGAVHAGRLRVIRLRHHRLQALIVKIDKQRVDALQDAGDRAIMQIEKAQGAASEVG